MPQNLKTALQPETKPLANSANNFVVSETVLEKTAALFEAAGDLERLRLLALLAKGELSVGEIAAQTNEKLSTVSQRLRLLRGQDLITSRRVGKQIFYQLADEHVAELISNALNHVAEHLLRQVS
jgi:DNA-binding transcriptional ArsR family regulator